MSLSRPRIGITMDMGLDENRPVFQLPADYAKSVIRAGGLPILLSWTHDPALRQEMIDLIDALLVPGGNDINPQLYGQPLHPNTKTVSPDRQTFDLAMLSLAEQRQLPTLGICLGCQLMNVHRRGTLDQHLPDVPRENPLLHFRAGDRSNQHEVAVRSGTRLADVLKLEKLPANSRHHQAIAKLGHGLVAVASAPDGVIEGIEDPTLPFWVAVQWHPENLADTAHERLFAALVSEARAYRNRRQNS